MLANEFSNSMKEKKLTKKQKSVLNKKTYAAIKKEKITGEIVKDEDETPESRAEKKIKFCELISKCVSIEKAAKSVGVWESTIYGWLKADNEFHELYTHAREKQADRLVEQMIDISDDTANDLISDQNGQRVNQEVIARSRLRVETRKWIASKMKPKVYGDSTKIDANVLGVMQHNIVATQEEILEMAKLMRQT